METTTIERTVATGGPIAREIVHELAQAFEHEISVKAVFGEPVQLDGHTVIPVAAIFASLGGGVGLGGAVGKALAGAVDFARRVLPRAIAGGAGGGFNVSVRPIGFIHDGKEGVTFTQIVAPPPVHPSAH